MFRQQLRARIGVRHTRAGRIAQQLALVVAADGGQAERHQARRRGARLQMARDDIAKVDGHIHATPGDVGQHGVKRVEVAVDIGYGGDSHAVSPPCVDHSARVCRCRQCWCVYQLLHAVGQVRRQFAPCGYVI
ncbi:hypothetical protein D3C72_1563840 [compost metagenome]